MGYRLLGEATMLVHFAFLVYVAAGGFLAWRWPRAFWPHLGCAVYALGITLVGWPCPLTHVENWARVQAGQAGIPGTSFMDAYLTGVVYPEQHLVTIQLSTAVVVAASWLGLALLLRHRAGGARGSETAPDPQR
ncbi:DUF2784 domain-containing protein [Allosalinactinospora lopnorensis]|uniref:DUF2784 domain-containing protein n=1 Tax=Allosalinactinospora lopnorensis TaxID=1352348 RepID=UPI000623BB47|nr:DUF2784 domain-containing protein [Allosalinactinospora lopnorensis]